MALKRALTLFLLSLPGAALHAQSAGVATVTTAYSSTPAFVCNAGFTNFVITLTGNVSSSSFSCAAPAAGSLKICQDGTGSRTFPAPTGSNGIGTIDPTALKCSSQAWSYDGTNINFYGLMNTTNAATPAGGSLLPSGSPTAGQIGIFVSPATIGGSTVSGDGSMNSSGVLTITQINGSNLTVSTAGIPTKIAGVSTAGLGVPVIGWQSALSNSSATSLVTLVSSAIAGDYEIHYNLDLHTACTTGTGQLALSFAWTGNSSRVLQTGAMALGSSQGTSSYLSGVQPIHVASGAITYTPALITACATGTATWDGDIWVTRAN